MRFMRGVAIAYVVIGLAIGLLLSRPVEPLSLDWWYGLVMYAACWPMVVLLAIIFILAALGNGLG